MPIILATVLPGFTEQEAGKIREEVERSLEPKGINSKHIAMEFTEALFPKRLIIKYESRASQLGEPEKCEKYARLIASIFYLFFDFPVECRVMHLGSNSFGTYVFLK